MELTGAIKDLLKLDAHAFDIKGKSPRVVSEHHPDDLVRMQVINKWMKGVDIVAAEVGENVEAVGQCWAPFGVKAKFDDGAMIKLGFALKDGGIKPLNDAPIARLGNRTPTMIYEAGLEAS